MEITKTLKNRFCRDCNLNIQVYDEPYFSERLKLFDKEALYNEFIETVNKFKNEEEYLAYYNELKDKVINYILASPAYIKLQAFDFTTVKNPAENLNNVSKGDVYKVPNNKNCYLSIDIAKGNFSALINFSRNYLSKDEWFNEGSYDYDKFISKFTDIEYFKKSKYIREVVFGKCNPKRQIMWERVITNNIQALLNCYDIDNSLKAHCDDELVYECSDLSIVNKIKSFLAVYNALFENYLPPLHINFYQLYNIKDTEIFMLRYLAGEEYDKGNRLELKKADPIESIYITRALKGEEPIEDDAVFYSDRHGLAKLLTSLNFDIKEVI